MTATKRTVLVSACLLNEPCRWHGRRAGYSSTVRRFQRENPEVELVPVCPEMLGGLPVPRPPCKRRGQRVWETCPDKADRAKVTGRERTEEFHAGARAALQIARDHGCTLAILARWSPSCDRTGIAGRLLLEGGIDVVNC
jgi:uncharacterized protein YbbK (DUF523 family)